MALEVRSPDGRRWRIRRRWVPRLGVERVLAWVRHLPTAKARRASGGGADARGWTPLAEIDVVAAAGLVVAVLLVAVVVALVVVLPLLFVLVDLAILAVVALLGIVGKVVFRRPWVVEAVTDRGKRHEWRVVGWRHSGERCHEIARSLEAGVIPAPDAAKP